ncbi:hypothetical protein F5B20DRAFT_541720 [Whalleya microplaca]|nr:hypothetical protein F5B20DRAFT_541720 [Whalleya microplaca]
MTPLSRTLLLGLNLAALGLAAVASPPEDTSVNHYYTAFQASDIPDIPVELFKRAEDPPGSKDPEGPEIPKNPKGGEKDCKPSDIRCKGKWFQLCTIDGEWVKWLQCKTGCVIEKGQPQCYPEPPLPRSDDPSEDEEHLPEDEEDPPEDHKNPFEDPNGPPEDEDQRHPPEEHEVLRSNASISASTDCTYMDYRCNGNALEVCSRTVGWFKLLDCKERCVVDDDNKPTCEQGNEQGREVNYLTSVDSSTDADGDCNSGDVRCNNNAVEVCYTNGTFLKVFECQNGCDIDQGNLQCYIGDQPQDTTAQFVASTSLVTAHCPEGERRCYDSNVQRCFKDSGWAEVEKCKRGCTFLDGTATCVIDDAENDGNAPPSNTSLTAAVQDRSVHKDVVVAARDDGCVHGSVRCNNDEAEACVDGTWTNLHGCPSCDLLNDSTVSCVLPAGGSGSHGAGAALRPTFFIWLRSLLRLFR